MNFTSFSLDPRLLPGIMAAGYTTPTPIQTQVIPEIAKGADLMGLAQTGTGKTAAFALPILHRLLQRQRGGVRALVLAPTRELAEQILEEFQLLASHTGLRCVSVYGGVGIQPQVQALQRADIVVACPGRLLDHIGRGTIDLSRVQILTLDEADQMFDMGFLPDIRRIISHLPRTDRQTLMFSATMPAPIRCLADEMLTDAVRAQVAHGRPAETVSHTLYPVAGHLKTALLLNLLGTLAPGGVLVFTRTKHRARQVAEKLATAGYPSTSLQGNLSQARRREAMNGFKSGKFSVMVATDIAARGIDVQQVSHVINYDMPATTEAYIHRIGRTGRAQRSGQALTLITEEDRSMVDAIQRAVGAPVEQCTVAGFDYRRPMAPGAQETPPRAVTHRRAKPTGRRPGGREAKGAFALFSPPRAGRTGRRATPSA